MASTGVAYSGRSCVALSGRLFRALLKDAYADRDLFDLLTKPISATVKAASVGAGAVNQQLPQIGVLGVPSSVNVPPD